jgi:hypothetical protein
MSELSMMKKDLSFHIPSHSIIGSKLLPINYNTQVLFFGILKIRHILYLYLIYLEKYNLIMKLIKLEFLPRNQYIKSYIFKLKKKCLTLSLGLLSTS